MTRMRHERVDETMLYVHLAEQHRREIPQPSRKSSTIAASDFVAD